MDKALMSGEESIKSKIFSIRGLQVMLDRDLAELYGVETKVFNQAVKRNIEKFPNDFRFQLILQEKNELVTKCDRLNVLKSDVAVDISVKIIRSFVEMRKFITNNALVFQRLDDKLVKCSHLLLFLAYIFM